MTTLVKICGIRSIDIGEFVMEAGADFLGFNFSPISKRKISKQEFLKMIDRLEAKKNNRKFVALFFDNSIEEIHDVTNSYKFDFIQYIDYDSKLNLLELEKLGIELLPQIGVRNAITDSDIIQKNPIVILDSYSEKEGGGTGKSFPWEFVSNVRRNFFLAGGLNPNNVRFAIDTLHPFGIDVASGVESSPGIKDKKLIEEFINNAKRT